MSNLLVISVPLSALFSGILCLFFWTSPRVQRWINLLGSVVQLIFSVCLLFRVQALGPQVLPLGAWAAPFGIVYASDLCSAVLLVVTALLASLIALYNFKGGISLQVEKVGYHAVVQFLIFGVSGAFACGDLFHLYVCFEILLMSSFVLMVLGGSPDQLKAALKYVSLNLLSSTFFLVSVGLLYAQIGTLNFADIYVKMSSLGEQSLALKLVARLMLVAFSIKAGLFPLFFWLPASYHTPAIPISALFAGLLTKVGLYSIFRLQSFVFPSLDLGTLHWLWWMSVATMVLGVLGALSKNHIRRILSIHILSQVGYVTLAFSLATPLAMAAGLYYMIHNMIAKTNLFLICGVIESDSGSDALKRNGGLYARAPWLSVLFLISALGLAGLPPLSGFFAKFFILQSALQSESFLSVAFVLGVGVLTLFSMLKIWNEVFWKLPVEKAQGAGNFFHSPFTPQMLSVTFLAVLVLLMGLFAGPFLNVLLKAAQSALDPSAYVQAVLGTQEGAL